MDLKGFIDRCSDTEYPNESPALWVEGGKLFASRIRPVDVLIVCEDKCSVTEGVRNLIWCALKDNNLYCRDEKRRSGEPVRKHPMGVAMIGLLEFDDLDVDMVIAALLHDALEDYAPFKGIYAGAGQDNGDRFFLDFLGRVYGERVAKIVLAVTKPLTREGEDSGAFKKRTYDRILNLFPEVAVKAAQLKVRDRLFNLRTPDSQGWLMDQFTETCEYFGPILVKTESFQYLKKILEVFVMMDVLPDDPEASLLVLRIIRGIEGLVARA